MLTEEQLKIRSTRVGASEIAALLGRDADGKPIHPYLSPFKLLKNKCFGSDFKSSPGMRFGNYVEQFLLAEHAEYTGGSQTRVQTLLHRDIDAICATPDGVFMFDPVGSRLRTSLRLVQCKWVGHKQHLWGPEGTDQVPLVYYAQVMLELGVVMAGQPPGTVEDEADLIALFDGEGAKYRVYTIKFDPEKFKFLADKATEFVKRIPTADTEGLDDWDLDDAYDLMKAKFPVSTDVLKPPSDKHFKLLRQYDYANRRVKKWGSIKDASVNRLCGEVGDAAGIDGVCTWKSDKRGYRTFRRIGAGK